MTDKTSQTKEELLFKKMQLTLTVLKFLDDADANWFFKKIKVEAKSKKKDDIESSEGQETKFRLPSCAEYTLPTLRRMVYDCEVDVENRTLTSLILKLDRGEYLPTSVSSQNVTTVFKRILEMECVSVSETKEEQPLFIGGKDTGRKYDQTFEEYIIDVDKLFSSKQ